MSGLRKLGSSILLGATSLLIILGGLSTTLAEDRIDNPKISITETSTPTIFLADVESETPSDLGLIPTATPIFTPTSTATIPASTSCPAPSGWLSYIVQVSETLESLATRYGTTAEMLKKANCLIGTTLLPDTRIYVPPAPTLTPIPCGAPYGWTLYTVKTGDTLYKISRAYRVSVAKLQNANCLGYSTNIKAGQKLYVPNVPTSTPVITQTFTFTPTPTSTATLSTPIPTYTPTSTAIATAISTASETATATQTLESPTETPTSTATQLPSPTFTFTPDP